MTRFPDIISTGKRLFNYKRPPLPAQYLISHPPYLSAPPKNSICCSKISPAGRSHGSCPYFSQTFKVWNKASQPVNVISSNTQKTNKVKQQQEKNKRDLVSRHSNLQHLFIDKTNKRMVGRVEEAFINEFAYSPLNGETEINGFSMKAERFRLVCLFSQ